MTVGTPPPSQGTCHICGAPLEPGTGFCGGCGAPVAPAAAAPAPAWPQPPSPGGVPWFKKTPAILGLAVIVVGGIVGALFVLKGGDENEVTTTTGVPVF